MTDYSFCFYGFVFFGIILSRYFLIAGGAHWLFYSALREFLDRWGIHRKSLQWKSIQRDMKLSMLSGVVFAISSALILSGYDAGLTLLYTDLHQYGLWYLGVSFLLVLLLQDTYFYFIHRVFHRRSVFRWAHHGHHRSGDPTPWTSFAFDLPEAIVQAIFFMGIVLIVPLHFITLVAVLMTMTIWAVCTHLGFEEPQAALPLSWLGKWLIGPNHHAIHHRKYTMHYGLYFTFWDKILGTQDPNYMRTGRAAQTPASSQTKP